MPFHASLLSALAWRLAFCRLVVKDVSLILKQQQPYTKLNSFCVALNASEILRAKKKPQRKTMGSRVGFISLLGFPKWQCRQQLWGQLQTFVSDPKVGAFILKETAEAGTPCRVFFVLQALQL